MKEEKYVKVTISLPENVELWSSSQARKRKMAQEEYLVKVLEEQVKKCK